jgi:hypothetical protein
MVATNYIRQLCSLAWDQRHILFVHTSKIASRASAIRITESTVVVWSIWINGRCEVGAPRH